MSVRMQQRKGTAEQWTLYNPILAAGEIGYETDNAQFKIGDGVNHWDTLSYFKSIDGLAGSLDDYVPLAQLGVNDGVATLDATGDVPLSQLGNVPAADLTGYATESFVSSAVSTLIDAAPAALDTLNELAAALGDDASFASTVTNSLATKADTSHVHAITDVTDLQTNLDGKAPVSHAHAVSDVTDLQTELDGKAAVVHTHTIANVTNLQTVLDAKAPATSAINDKAASYAIVAGDVNALIRSTGSAITATINNVLTPGQKIDFIQAGTGQITFAAGSGVSLLSADSKFLTAKQYAAATVICGASGIYYLVGNLA